MDNKYVFISYSHNDSPKVLSIIEAMKKRGVAIWYDEGIEAGTEWPEYIAERIKESSVFIAFMSPSAAASMNCRNEINYALSLGKEMLIVHLEETNLSSGMQLQLGSLQAMFYNRSKDEAEFMDNLLRSKILQDLIPVDNAPTLEEHVVEFPKRTQEKTSVAVVTESAPADKVTSELSVEDRKKNLISDIITPIFAIVAVVLGALEMHFVTKYIQNGFLIFLFGVIAPLLVFVPFHTVYKFKMQNCSTHVTSHVSGNCAAYAFVAFVAQVITDVFYIHSTDNVFFKILISIGINLVAYFIVFLSAPPEKY